jgi:PPOX class probable F420-dependent enzyme
MPLQFGPRLQTFLDQPLPTTIGTIRSDGSVQMNPVWFEYRDGQLWLNGGPNRGWFHHLRRDPRITLFVIDGANMWRWAQIQGRLVDSTTEGADDHIDRLSMRYLGHAYQNPKVDRLIIKIEPYRVTGGDNWQPWDVS